MRTSCELHPGPEYSEKSWQKPSISLLKSSLLLAPAGNKGLKPDAGRNLLIASSSRDHWRPSMDELKEQASRLTYTFGPFQLDPAERRLIRDGIEIRLTPKVFETLVLLVERHGLL